MGTCSTKQKQKIHDNPNLNIKSTKIQINCPICEQNYDTHRHKPYVVCTNKHKFCLSCLQSMSNHTSLKKKQKLLCPFCKMEINEDMKQTDAGIYKFLEAELSIMKKLPENQKNLFAFSSLYLPTLHKFMTDQINKGNNTKAFQTIEMLRIKGRMLQEYQVFQMGMLDCIKGLKKIYLNKNHIKAIDTTFYSQNKLQLIDLSKNRLVNIRSLIDQAKGVFAYLKVLKVDNNLIQDLTGVDKFKYLQVVTASHNVIKDIGCFANCPELRFINLEFNKLITLSLSSIFSQLYSLQLFGNQIHEGEWDKVINFTSWNQLRLLTASVITQNLIDVYSAHKKIEKKLSSALLKLIIFEMKQQSHENMSELTQNIKDKRQLLTKTRIVEISQSNYLFFIQNKGFVQQIIEHVVRFHPLGLNINFRPQHINKTVYQEDDNLYTYKKITKNKDSKNYLYSSKIITDKGKIFIGFRMIPCRMTFGICQGIPYNRIIELDASEELFNLSKNAKQDCEVQVFMSLNIQGNFVSFTCGQTTLKKFFPQRWQQYRFFVNIQDQGGKFRVIRNEISII